ncbi:pyruvate, water dikinase regulatory protein [Clostridium sp. MB40-C1]|uniref:pyruvate, water dikinase regulatory protein n=1 Tax=Clostridium sp. MB40-C1 TaxID=3070996 RepID=UPI0027E0967F|nr:pyruvate, water dikinase regulatory protein [Clostridium sp. MB40-C1]WMJ80120.1 pyruvate, water dikinase regulatory protein [Clostridium sp. MB40-C1]
MLTVYAVSDSIGETAELVARASANQFRADIQVKRIPYVKSPEDVNEFINSIKEPKNATVISTVVLVEVREFLVERCIERGINIVNILGPCISTISRLIGIQPQYAPGAVWEMDEKYFKKIEAMEFAIQYDDSKNISGIKHADVVLIGLSRTSKTPLCMYLANKGIKALNIPLLPEIPIPEDLFEIDRKKIVGLTIDPIQLMEIRKHRLSKIRTAYKDIEYANVERVFEEIDFAEKLMRRLRCKTIDVTKRAIEDTALIIMKQIGHNFDYK